jgi:hypothetical protein
MGNENAKISDFTVHVYELYSFLPTKDSSVRAGIINTSQSECFLEIKTWNPLCHIRYKLRPLSLKAIVHLLKIWLLVNKAYWLGL